MLYGYHCVRPWSLISGKEFVGGWTAKGLDFNPSNLLSEIPKEACINPSSFVPVKSMLIRLSWLVESAE